ncbi:4Fe-4S binding protein [Oxalobacteraceae bacterium R-40]|uniref:4Fe-4S binding protein n=1 Tax=Keguizhuia sedimenti TaxID=3064264 RepID=A0ABU1BMN2_9BURK|nr:4Fe-4S binding protein [Oxalobacteraceae bacterium R-40]
MAEQFKICSCNRSMPLNAESGQKLAAVLDAQMLSVSTQLCSRDMQSFVQAAGGGDTVIIGCTQERPLFNELAQENNAYAPLRFVDLKSLAGRDGQARPVLPKMAALLADAALPAADSVPSVSYVSRGSVLIIGMADVALRWADALQDQLQVQVLITGGGAESTLPAERSYPVLSGSEVAARGWLGAFQVEWKQSNPIDLDVCVRCNACIHACPEQAIDLLYQVNTEKCRTHGDCVAACGEVRAIDFNRTVMARNAECDLVFDLSETALVSRHQPPYGYFYAAPHDPQAQSDAALRLVQMTGEFEKPKYFRYKEKLCAHGRNGKTGCTACVDICSAQAISSEGSRISVEPHLCAGCGACTTVCPSGAISYAYPDAPHTALRLKTMLQTYAKAGGRHPGILFHGNEQGAHLLTQLSRLAGAGMAQSGVPANMLPVALHHAASAGIELWLAAIAYGAASVAVLVTRSDAPPYVAALKHQLSIAQLILSGLGYAGRHLHLIEANSPAELGAALSNVSRGDVPAQAATFNAFAEKRSTMEFAIDHLYRHAPLKNDLIELPPASPFGALKVDTDACSLCMACTGACPTSALLSTPDRPQLRFIEKNCVQCGLCATTCPENAIALHPRLNLADSARQAATLSETQPFECIRCQKPIGTLKMVEGMLAKLSGHGAFAGNLDRLRMCGDCRVIDMMESKSRQSVTELQRTP